MQRNGSAVPRSGGGLSPAESLRQTAGCLLFPYGGNVQLAAWKINSPDWSNQSGEFAVQSPGHMTQARGWVIPSLGDRHFPPDCTMQSLCSAGLSWDESSILLRKTVQPRGEITLF